MEIKIKIRGIWIIVLIIVCIVALTAGLTTGIAALLYAILACLVTLFGFIPFIGPVIYWLVMAFVVEPFVASFVPLGPWAGILYWIFGIFSIIYCLITSLILLAALADR